MGQRSSRATWAKRVERWRDSGLTAKEFAAEVGTNARTLSYWKWKLRQGSSAPRKTARRRASPKPSFVEVSVAEPPAVHEAKPLELVVGRVTIRLPRDFDDETLSRLLRVLERRA
ncbi:MAG: hypothetical protein ACFCGT_27635 [Sandaracinaceae bacterium]